MSVDTLYDPGLYEAVHGPRDLVHVVCCRQQDLTMCGETLPDLEVVDPSLCDLRCIPCFTVPAEFCPLIGRCPHGPSS